jgi:hypothetical protein
MALFQGKSLSFGPKEADVEKILDETNSGKHFSFEDSEYLKQFILEKYEEWKSGETSLIERNISQYSRRNLTKKLVEVLEK